MASNELIERVIPTALDNLKRRYANLVEELNFKLAPDSRVSLVFTSKQKVTQEDFDLLMKMLELQKTAFPKAADLANNEDEEAIGFFKELDEMEESDATSAY